MSKQFSTLNINNELEGDISPEASALLEEIESDIKQAVNIEGIDSVRKSINQSVSLNTINGSSDQYRDTAYQDRYQDTVYKDNYNDNVSYRDGTK